MPAPVRFSESGMSGVSSRLNQDQFAGGVGWPTQLLTDNHPRVPLLTGTQQDRLIAKIVGADARIDIGRGRHR